MKRLKYRVMVDDVLLDAFRHGVFDWYRVHGRALPWRMTRDPYAIVVSEIMLHQTTVMTVVPVYNAFMQTFPTVEALHAAPLEAVKTITDPLGYKVRGRWLKEIAAVVVERWKGEWPQTVEELMTLPGVGRYTAGAILSFAFGVDAPILDTNVRRVVGRYFGLNYRDTRAETEHRLWALAEAVVPPGQAVDFNQALMDFGAMVCTARKPACTVCPLYLQCQTGGAAEAPTTAAEAPARYQITRRRPADQASSIS
ncbi:MAG: A/G-specific adenine glycosylase [Firmicutes bacterium]|nr:A/G-specific adenine glycosylase [Bacillota bacterium]